MIRLFVVLIALTSVLSFSGSTYSALEPAGYIFEGRISAGSGEPVIGVEIHLADVAGNVRRRAFSGMDGQYELPLLLPAKTEIADLRLSVTHIYYQSENVDDVLQRARIGTRTIKEGAKDRSMPFWGPVRTVRRDFVLARSHGTTQFSGGEAPDPAVPEGYFRTALLLAAQNRTRDASEMMKIYAQTGRNPREVKRSLDFLSKYDRSTR